MSQNDLNFMNRYCKNSDRNKKWLEFMNMSSNELETFLNSKEGKIAGISQKKQREYRKEKKNSTLRRGRTSAKNIIEIKEKIKKKEPLTVEKYKNDFSDCDWIKHQVNFNTRTEGALYSILKKRENKLPKGLNYQEKLDQVLYKNKIIGKGNSKKIIYKKDNNGNRIKERIYLALLVWGYDPKKPKKMIKNEK